MAGGRNTHMKRDEWQFEYTALKLADSAASKKAQHCAKLLWWEDKKKETMKKVGETGIEVHDSVASSYSNTKGGFGPQITIDSGLQRDLTECQQKMPNRGFRVGTHFFLIFETRSASNSRIRTFFS